MTNLAAASITVTSATGHQTATLAQRFGGVLNVKTDFGCAGTGLVDDGPKIQFALNALQVGGSATALYFPAGTYKTNQVLYIVNTTGVRIFGDGTISTVIQYTGSPTAGNTEAPSAGGANAITPVIMTNGFSYSSLSGIRLNNQVGASTCGIYLFQDSAHSKGTTEQLHISDMLVDGGCDTGYLVGYQATALCSEIMFENCVVNSCTSYGFRNVSSNALNNNLYNCGGVGNAIWANIATGTMNVYGASLAVNTVDISTGQLPTSIIGSRTESANFIDTTASSGTRHYVAGCNQAAGAGAGYFINVGNQNRIVIDSCVQESTNSTDGLINGASNSCYIAVNSCAFGNMAFLSSYSGNGTILETSYGVGQLEFSARDYVLTAGAIRTNGIEGTALSDISVRYNTNFALSFTVTIASPGVFTTGVTHGLIVGTPIAFFTTGALPTGLSIGTTYYIISAGLTTTTFRVSATSGGAAINTTGTQSGSHSLRGVRVYAVGDQILKNNVAAGGSPGWICTTAGEAIGTAVFKALANVAP